MLTEGSTALMLEAWRADDPFGRRASRKCEGKSQRLLVGQISTPVFRHLSGSSRSNGNSMWFRHLESICVSHYRLLGYGESLTLGIVQIAGKQNRRLSDG
jgi:hypothetical protein